MMDKSFPTRAVILAAGMGTRLRPYTDDRPKPLVEVHGEPILLNALKNLTSRGVAEITIVVGYQRDMIRNSFGNSFAGARINYITSDVFDRTGSAYSLWLARSALGKGASYLLEGDVFFEAQILDRLCDREGASTAAVAPFTSEMEGSAVTLTPEGRISGVRMRQTVSNIREPEAPPLFKTMNLFAFSPRALRDFLVPALDEMVRQGAVETYTEQILAEVIHNRDLPIQSVNCGDLKWYEIDSAGDLRIAENIFAQPQLPFRSSPDDGFLQTAGE